MGGGDANPLDQLNLNSALLNTGLTIQTGHSAAKKKPANGFLLLWIGITTNTAIAASNL